MPFLFDIYQLLQIIFFLFHILKFSSFLFSVAHRFQHHGSSVRLGVLCLSRHLDEIWIWSWQRFFKVSFFLAFEFTISFALNVLSFSKLRINVDVTVAMRCQREYPTSSRVRLWASRASLWRFSACRRGSRYPGFGGNHDHVWWFAVRAGGCCWSYTRQIISKNPRFGG